MEKLREKMYLYIELYGPIDKRTVEVSQELDILIVQDMKGRSKN